MVSINGHADGVASCDALTAKATVRGCPSVELFPYAERISLSRHKVAKMVYVNPVTTSSRRARTTSAQSCRWPTANHKIDTITDETLPASQKKSCFANYVQARRRYSTSVNPELATLFY